MANAKSGSWTMMAVIPLKSREATKRKSVLIASILEGAALASQDLTSTSVGA